MKKGYPSNIEIQITINEKYDKMRDFLPDLYGCLHYKNKKIDMKTTFINFGELWNSSNKKYFKERRILVKTWIDLVYTFRKSLSDEWLWEMSFRIDKLIKCSICMERINLETVIGCNPTKTDIPTSLLMLYDHMMSKRGSFLELKKKYVQKVNRYKIFNVYYEKFEE